MQPGGTYAGYRYATAAEISTLLLDAGLSSVTLLNDTIGSFLVRDNAANAVPEPGSLGLVAFGFAAMAFSARRRVTRTSQDRPRV